jgi:hypothetical protein
VPGATPCYPPELKLDRHPSSQTRKLRETSKLRNIVVRHRGQRIYQEINVLAGRRLGKTIGSWLKEKPAVRFTVLVACIELVLLAVFVVASVLIILWEWNANLTSY